MIAGGLDWRKVPTPLGPGLEPILDWMFILVLAPLYACLGVWLWRSKDKA